MGRIVQVENETLRDDFLTLEQAWEDFPLFGLFEKSVGTGNLTASSEEDTEAEKQSEIFEDTFAEAEENANAVEQEELAREKIRQVGGDYMQHSQMNALWCALEERANVVGLKVSPEALFEFDPEKEDCDPPEENPFEPPIKGQIVVPPSNQPDPEDIPQGVPQEEGEIDVYWFEQGETPDDSEDPCESEDPNKERTNVAATNKAEELRVTQINAIWDALKLVCVRYCSPKLRRKWVNLQELLAELNIGEAIDPDPMIPDPDDTEFPPTKFIKQNAFSIIPDRPNIILYRRIKEGTASTVENVLFNDEPTEIGDLPDEEDPIERGKGGFGKKTFGLSIPGGTPTFVDHINEAYLCILALEYMPCIEDPSVIPALGSASSDYSEIRVQPSGSGCINPTEQDQVQQGDWQNFSSGAFGKAGDPVGFGGPGNTRFGGRVSQSLQSRCGFPFLESTWQAISQADPGFTAYKAEFTQIEDGKHPDVLEFNAVVFSIDLCNAQTGKTDITADGLSIPSLWTLSVGTLLGTDLSTPLPFNKYKQGSPLGFLSFFATNNAGFECKDVTEEDFEWEPDTVPQPDGTEVFIINTFIENVLGFGSAHHLPFPIPDQNTVNIGAPNNLGESSWTAGTRPFRL